MTGLFGDASKDEKECVHDLFYGTDYHSHLGTFRGGLAVMNSAREYMRYIHDITTTQFRSKFENDITKIRGNMGIGVISDTDNQPLIVGSGLGEYAITTLGKLANLEELTNMAYSEGVHLLEQSPTEISAYLINKGSSFEEGIQIVQDNIKGSCSLLLLTKNGIYAARDKLGRTPLIIGKKNNAYAVTCETTAFPNLDFETERDLGPGEIVLITPEGVEQKKKPENKMQICSFLWVYYGYPSSNYEGINVEVVRRRCGAALAKADKKDIAKGDYKVDLVAGIPDSGTSHGQGYANEAEINFGRPIVKYTPTWPRSFMPQDQETRDLIAKMKLVPIREMIIGQSLLFCEDSIVRGTQLEEIIKMIIKYGAKQVHMRPACPPLTYPCKFLNFSRAKSPLELAGRKAIKEIKGTDEISDEELKEYHNPCSNKHCAMVERIRMKLGLTTLKYQKLDDLVTAIGLPKEKLCTHCWDGSSYF